METLSTQETTDVQNIPAPQPRPRYKTRVVLLFLIVAFLFFLSFLFLINTHLSPKSLLIRYVPTPTPISLPANAYEHLTISLAPLGNSQNNNLFATISATFSRSLTPAEKIYTKIALSPGLKGSLMWSKNNTIISFTPNTHLDTDKTYSVVLTYGSLIKTWSFSTVSQANLSQEDINNVQLQSDEQYGVWQNNLYNNYPWYDNFPLQTKDYYTYFDIDTKEFMSNLYAQPTDSDKIKILKQQIMETIQSLGIDTEKYKFVWNITP